MTTAPAGPFSIGVPADPRDCDPRFATYAEAEADAMLAYHAVRAVWDDASGDLLTLVFRGVVYRPISILDPRD